MESCENLHESVYTLKNDSVACSANRTKLIVNKPDASLGID